MIRLRSYKLRRAIIPVNSLQHLPTRSTPINRFQIPAYAGMTRMLSKAVELNNLLLYHLWLINGNKINCAAYKKENPAFAGLTYSIKYKLGRYFLPDKGSRSACWQSRCCYFTFIANVKSLICIAVVHHNQRFFTIWRFKSHIA